MAGRAAMTWVSSSRSSSSSTTSITIVRRVAGAPRARSSSHMTSDAPLMMRRSGAQRTIGSTADTATVVVVAAPRCYLVSLHLPRIGHRSRSRSEETKSKSAPPLSKASTMVLGAANVPYVTFDESLQQRRRPSARWD